MTNPFPVLLSAVPIVTDPPCGDHPDLFFPDTEQVDAYEEAIALCQTCSGKTACLEFAVENKVRYGAWGGTSPVDRHMWNYGVPKNDEEFGRYINTEKYYTAKELAAELGKSSATVLKLVRQGTLHKPDYVINHRAYWKRSTVDLEALKHSLRK